MTRQLICLHNFVFLTLFISFTFASSKLLVYTIPENEPAQLLDSNVAESNGFDQLSVLRSFEESAGSSSDCDGFSDAVFLFEQNLTLVTLRELDRELCPEYTALGFSNDLGQSVVISVIVEDVNDHTPHFTHDVCNLIINEEEVVGSGKSLKADCVPEGFFAVDDDQRKSGVFGVDSFEILSGNENSLFILDVKETTREPFLVWTEELDVDQPDSTQFVTMVIAVYDKGDPPKSATATVSVTIEDANDNDPVFDLSTYRFEVNETAEEGSLVGQVHALDIDSTPNNSLVQYYLQEDSALEPFSVSPDNGEVRVNGYLDHENVSQYFLEVLARDSPANGLYRSTQAVIEIVVLDANEHPPMINFTFYSAKLKSGFIDENFKVGQAIGQVDISDEDSQISEVQLTLTDASDTFSLGACPQGTCIVLDAQLDRESKDSYVVQVSATESVPPFRTTSRFFTLQVADVNDNSPQFNQNALKFSLQDNSPAGTFVGQVSASDEDLNQAISYAIIDSEMFRVESDSGQIFTLVSVSCADLASSELPLSFLVRASDSGSPLLSTQKTVTVDIVGIENQRPVFQPSDEYSVSITESTDINTCILQVSAELSSCMSSPVRYSLENSEYSDWFSVSVQSGEICTIAALDFEASIDTNGLVHLVVFAYSDTDTNNNNNNLVQNSSASVAVQLTDSNEFKPVMSETEYRQDLRYFATNVGSVVAKVSASDGDRGPLFGKVTYLIESGNEQELFQIDPSIGDISLAKPLPPVDELGENSTFVLTVAAVDGGGFMSELSSQVVLTVVGVDATPPMFSETLYRFSVSEGPSAVSTAIGVVQAAYATEDDEQRPVSYSLGSGSNGNWPFSIDETSGSMTLTSELDAEMQAVFVVTVAAASVDEPDVVGYCQVEVTVLDTNDNAPVFNPGQYHWTVSEGLEVGQVVGSVFANDADTTSVNNEISFSIQPQTNQLSVSNNGQVILQSRLDREETSLVVFIVVATDSGSPALESSATVSLGIEDVNDNAPEFTMDSYLFEVKENNSAFESIGSVFASDVDEGLNSQLVYSLKSSDPLIMSTFGVDSLSGVVYSSRYLDHEERGRYEFEIVATDLGVPFQLTGSAPVVVLVLDVNDRAPVFSSDTYSFSVLEGPGSSFVGEVAASDADSGVNGQVRFSIEVNSEDVFSVNSVTGVISTNRILDRETQPLREIEVKAVDLGVPPKSATAIVYIHVLEVNDNAPRCEADPYRVLIHESASVSTVVARVHAVDPDAPGDNSRISFSLDTADEQAGKFSIDQDSGEITLDRSLNYEVEQSIILTVVVKDFGIPALSSSCQVEVTVLDDNEFGPRFASDFVEFRVDEGVPPGYIVGTVTARDADTPFDHSVQESFVRYFIISGLLSMFHVDSISGEISTKSDIDFEQTQLVELVIRAVDTESAVQSDEYYSADVNVKVRVNDRNDNTPVFDNQIVQLTVKENSPLGTVLGKVSATDDDSGINGEVRYVIYDQSPPDYVTIDEVLGTLKLNQEVDFEGLKDMDVLVMAHDSPEDEGSVRMSFCTVVITVIDQNDNAPEFHPPFSVNVSEDHDPKFYFFKVNATDADSGTNGVVQYYLNSHTDMFTIRPETGFLYLRENLDRERVAQYNLSITARDGAVSPQKSAISITVNVQDVNDNPVKFQGPFDASGATLVANISENMPVDSYVTTIEVTDADEGDLITFELEAVVPEEQNLFSLDASSGILRTLAVLDTEAKDVYAFIVFARDSRNNIQHQTVAPMKIFVDNQNDFPPVILDCPRDLEVVEEQDQPLMEVFRATDDDKSVNGVIEFSLKSAEEGEDIKEKFKITNHDKGAAATLTLMSPVDREEKSRYRFYVIAEDHGEPPKNSSCLITVYVGDINDNAPLLTSSSPDNVFVQIEEMMSMMAEIKVNAVDPDKDSQDEADVRFAIASCSCGQGIFKIDEVSGEISLYQPLDYEKMKECVLNVSGTDDGGRGLTSYIEVKVIVMDRNDNAPVFTQVIQKHFTTAPSAGDLIATLAVLDPDEQGTNEFSFEDDSAVQEDFNLEGEFKQKLMAKRTLTESSYLFLVKATNNPQGLTATGLVDITIGVAEPERLVFSEPSYSASIEESSPADTFIVQVVAERADDAPASPVVYALFSPTVEAALKIDSSSGKIYVNNSELLDYEEVEQITVHVQASAVAVNESTTTGEEEVNLVGFATVVVDLVNLNDNEPYFTSDYNQISIHEGSYSQQNPVVVQDIQVEDADQRSDSLALSIVSMEPASDPPVFQFRHHLLTAVGELDREKVPAYVLTVRVTDSAAEKSQNIHSTDKELTITVLDVNDNPATFDNFPSTKSVLEDEKVGYVIGTYPAKDADVDATITYGVTYARKDGETTSAFIMDNDGNLILNNELDYEQRSQYVLKLKAFDGLFTNERELTVNVLDINDNSPKFEQDMYEAKIDSGIPVGTRFVQVHASDKDSGLFGKVTYSIIADESNAFKINSTSGEIYPSSSLQKTNENSMTFVTVKAKDGGDPALEATVRVNIKIIDNRQADESPIILPIDPVFVDEDKPVNSEIARVIATFPDGSESSYIKYNLTSGNVKSAFELVLGTEMQTYGALLVLSKALDRETLSKYELKVLAYDERKPSLNSTATFLVYVRDVNDNKPSFVGTPYRANVSIAADVEKAVLRIQAEDEDENANAKITYRITAGNQKGYFAIDSSTGWISLRTKLDTTVGDEIKLTVSANDPDFTSRTSVIVKILNENEDAPKFPKSVYNFHFLEGKHDSFAFILQAWNGRGQTIEGLKYEIMDTEVLDMFYMNPFSGRVDFTQPPDYEAKSNYSFHIRAYNNQSQSDITVVNVNIVGVDEFPPFFNNTPIEFAISANLEKGAKVGQVVAVDADRGTDGIVRYRFTKNYPNFRIDSVTGEIMINETFAQNQELLPEETQSDTVILTLLVEASSQRPNSLHKIEAVEVAVDFACCPGILPMTQGDKNPVNGVILAIIVVVIVVVLVVGGIAVLACVFHRTKNQAGHPGSVSGSPTHESFQNGFMNVNGTSPHSTPSRNSSMHIYPNTLTMHNGILSSYHQNSNRSANSSGRGSALNDPDAELKRIHDQNLKLATLSPEFLGYQKDSGFADMQDNVSMNSIADNTAEVILGDQHVYASASIESVHPFADEAGRSGMSSLIYAKLHEIGADQFDPHKPFQGSFNSLVGPDLRENYNWDHLLNWNPQFYPLAQVFDDIAKLKHNGDTSPGALPEPSPHLFSNGNSNQSMNFPQSNMNTPQSKKNSHAPFLSNMVPPGSQAVHPYRQPNGGIVTGHPNSREGYPMPPSQGRAGNSNQFAPTSYAGGIQPGASISSALQPQHKPSPSFNQMQQQQMPPTSQPQQQQQQQQQQPRNHKLSNGSLNGSTTSTSSGSAKLPVAANHKSLSKQQHLAMGVNGANGRSHRPSAKTRPIREEQV